MQNNHIVMLIIHFNYIWIILRSNANACCLKQNTKPYFIKEKGKEGRIGMKSVNGIRMIMICTQNEEEEENCEE